MRLSRRPALRFAAAATLLAVAAAPVAAQQPTPAPRPSDALPVMHTPSPGGALPINRIVAIVGDRPILESEVEEMINAQRARGMRVPEDSAGQIEVVRQVIGQLVDEELLYQAATADTSIVITDQDLKTQVDQTVERAQAQVGGEAQLREALRSEGLGSLEEWRRSLSEQVRKSQAQQRLLQKLKSEDKLPPVPVSDAEVQEAFERNKEARPRKPAQVGFRQIIVAPKPTQAAKNRARIKAESLLVEIRGGANFEQVAKRESMDGTRETGGDLGWNRRGKMVPEFERWMFALAPGQMSPVVETPFGYHIIRVDRVQPAEVKARHILIMPTLDSADAGRARLEADSVAQALRAGANFDSLSKVHHDFPEQQLVSDWPIDSLPASYQSALRGQAANTVTAPFAIENPRTGFPKYVVAQVFSASAGGEYTLEDVQNIFRKQLSEERAIRRYIDGLRKSTFVSIRL